MAKLPLLLSEFDQAVQQLASALQRKEPDDLIRAGCIQYFEFCFEIAWKALQMSFREEGLPECYSPKHCLQQAFKMGLIAEDPRWYQMLQDRNRTVHTYDYSFSLEVYTRLNDHLPLLQSLLKKLQEK